MLLCIPSVKIIVQVLVTCKAIKEILNFVVVLTTVRFDFIVKTALQLYVCKVTYRLGSTQLNKTEQEVKHNHARDKNRITVNSQYCHISPLKLYSLSGGFTTVPV